MAQVKRRYGSLTRELGLTPCHGTLPTSHYCGLTRDEHVRGRVTGRIVHFPNDAPNWARTKVFLSLCAAALDPTLNDPSEPHWRKVYRLNIASREVGRRLHIRVPRRFLRFDGLVVLAGVTGLPDDIPLRKQAFDWARR